MTIHQCQFCGSGCSTNVCASCGVSSSTSQVINLEDRMSKWPNAPRDYDSFLLNTWHKNPGKTQKLKIYRYALELACRELSRIHKQEYTGDSDYQRVMFINEAVHKINDGVD